MNIVLNRIKRIAFDSRLKNQYTDYALKEVQKELGQHYEEEMKNTYYEYLEICSQTETRFDEENVEPESGKIEEEAKKGILRLTHAFAENFVRRTLNDDFMKKFNEHFSNTSNIPEDANKFFKREELEQYIDVDRIASAIEETYKDYIEGAL